MRNFAASARVAFALMAPALAGCAAHPRVPAIESCSYSNEEEAREAFQGSINRIVSFYSSMVGKKAGLELEIEGLGQQRLHPSSRFFFDMVLGNLESEIGALKGMVHRLTYEAGEGRGIRLLAQEACMLEGTAEILYDSGMRLIEMASAEIMAAMKEME